MTGALLPKPPKTPQGSHCMSEPVDPMVGTSWFAGGDETSRRIVLEGCLGKKFDTIADARELGSRDLVGRDGRTFPRYGIGSTRSSFGGNVTGANKGHNATPKTKTPRDQAPQPSPYAALVFEGYWFLPRNQPGSRSKKHRAYTYPRSAFSKSRGCRNTGSDSSPASPRFNLRDRAISLH